MRHNLLKSIAAAGIMIFGLTYSQASAQQYRDDEGWHHDRDSFYRGNDWKMKLFDRVREDLDHVQADAFSGGDEQHMIGRTKDRLNELQGKMVSGGYDQPALDEVIGSLSRVLADNRLSQRDRDMLTDDLNRMKDYRDHHADWH